MVCQQLNMEESVAEIMTQLGTDENGKVSFQDFTRCHRQLVGEIRKEEMDLSLKSGKSSQKKLRDRIASWPTSSDNSLGRSNKCRWDDAPLSLLYYVQVASPPPTPLTWHFSPGHSFSTMASCLLTFSFSVQFSHFLTVMMFLNGSGEPVVVPRVCNPSACEAEAEEL